MSDLPRLVVSIGCPCGVGPEVSVSAAAELQGPVQVARAHVRSPVLQGARALLVGDVGALRAAARVRNVDPSRLVEVKSPDAAWTLDARAIAVWQPARALAAKDRAPGRPTRASGAAQLAWIDAACDLVTSGGADALVTGPVSKEAIARSGAPGSRDFLGHTEHLQRRLRAREVVMAFWAERLVTALVTTHLPLSAVPRAVTAVAVARASYWLADLLVATGVRAPTIAVSGLNPHAGEGGLLGREETRAIVPGMARAKKRLAEAKIRATLVGPVPSESAFRLAVAGTFAGVVAMYHDQATIAMKLASFGEAVNVSLGLPIVRTSVDHGTAYDRAGSGTASDAGMRGALHLAARLAG